jgi:hypothetical protein
VQELGATRNRSGNSDSLTKNFLFRLPTVEQILSLFFGEFSKKFYSFIITIKINHLQKGTTIDFNNRPFFKPHFEFLQTK